MRKATILTLLLSCSLYILRAQNVSDLFQKRTALSKSYTSIASKYESLELNPGKLASLRSQAPETLKLDLPFESKQLKLDLKKVRITSADFSVIEALPNGESRRVNYNDGIFYQGKIEGRASSFATISLIGGQVMGIIADDQGNIVLGAIEDKGVATNEYSLYREKDLQVRNPMTCFTTDEPVTVIPTANTQARENMIGEPVDIYFECDNRFYQDRGSNTINVINYVLGFFNNTALLYGNENIKVQVSQIKVWTTADPEVQAGLNSTSAVLNAFRDRMDITSYIGDYAHFLSTRNLGGGIAYILGSPCSSEKRFRTAVSAIDNNYNNFPTYSWTVEVVTHELGHNFGSNHTQWCGWTGGALDNCVATEASAGGPCSPGPTPTTGGTIMSYCHLTGIGINFNNGFGQQPGDRIRSVIGSAACFATCRMTIDISKLDASCNQNNGAATVTATNATGALTYLWSNGQTGATLSNAAPGTYHVTVADAGGCQVIDDIVIGNSGTALSFSLTPNGTAAFCGNNNTTLTATNNPAYQYQWSLAGNPIIGANTNTYVTNVAGNYSVNVISGACSGTQSVQLVQVTAPVAAINPGGTTTFCNGSNVVLNGNAGSGYTYQWYNSGNPVTGATNATYTATTSGSYTVKVSAGTACEATSAAVLVTVNPSPVTAVTTTGLTSFCEGGSAILTASSGNGYSYQWYRNGSPLTGFTEASYTASTAGTYTVMTTLGSCSQTSSGTNITVLAKPSITVTPDNSTIEKFQVQTLTATGAPLYNWSSLPDMVNSTANSGTFRPLTTTTYMVEGTAANGCKNKANATINVIGCGTVTDFSTKNYSPSRVFISWINPIDVTTDTLQYRKLGETNWTSIFVTGNSFELSGLQPGTDYEYNIIPLCATSSVFIPSATQTLRTAALENGRYVRLFPNPVQATSRLEIIVSTGFTLQTAIYDNTGKLVWQKGSQTLPAGQYIQPIEADALASGVYFVAVTIDGKKETIKMIVVH